VKVENLAQVRVRVNDCGPYVVGRSLDLSLALAPRKKLASPGKEQRGCELPRLKSRETPTPTAASDDNTLIR
jgi:rare lipoprotein A (peptidoglycan hydrolase)